MDRLHHTPGKISVGDFTTHFRNRYTILKNILLNRAETVDAISISKLNMMGTSERTTVIVMISDIRIFPSGSVRLEIEDLSGSTTAVISGKREDLKFLASQLVLDDIVALRGSGTKTFFVDDIIWPDIPEKQVHKTQDEVYAAFSGDIHAGSNMFLPKNFTQFIKWLRGEIGDNRQKDMAAKTKYVFFAGDIVDGIGVYPGQDKELTITDIYKQYDEAASFLQQIPDDKEIIICPGNHDGMRLAEPQAPLYKDFAAPIYELPNVINVGNPSYVNIHGTAGNPGVDVLLYHGYSFDRLINWIEPLRLAGGYDRPDKIIEFLLKRRHLAPVYGSTPALPMKEDALLIKDVPEIIATGHIHKAKIARYKNILTISASCWQDRTSFQEKVGHHPDPAMVPIVNLKTRKVYVTNYPKNKLQ